MVSIQVASEDVDEGQWGERLGAAMGCEAPSLQIPSYPASSLETTRQSYSI
jgi:hypothetical protein